MSKECFKCLRRLPLSQFYKHAAMGDGHLGKCKDCCIKAEHKRRSEKIDEIRAYDRKRASLPHRIAERKRYQKSPRGKRISNKAKRDWAERNTIKRAAQYMVCNAVRDGRLMKLPCRDCGSTKRIHGHHEDYSKPLDVIWLCPKHHAELHKRKRGH